MLKKFFVHFRTSIRVTSILFLSTFLILMALVVIYKPIYSVTLNGEVLLKDFNLTVRLEDKIALYESGEITQESSYFEAYQIMQDAPNSWKNID